MARNDPQVNFRIPADLNEKLKEAAQSNNRTITAELVSRLESTFDGSLLTIPQAEKLANDVAHRVSDSVISRIINPLDEKTFQRVLVAMRAAPRPQPQEEFEAQDRAERVAQAAPSLTVKKSDAMRGTGTETRKRK